MLIKDKKAYAAIQVFVPREGMCNLGAGGPYTGDNVQCATDGSITFNWPSGGTDTIAYTAGADFGLSANVTVTIVSGTFHIS